MSRMPCSGSPLKEAPLLYIEVTKDYILEGEIIFSPLYLIFAIKSHLIGVGIVG